MISFVYVKAQHFDENHQPFSWVYHYNNSNPLKAFWRFDRWRQYAKVIQNTNELLEIEYIKNNITIGWCNYIKVVIQRPGMLEKMWKEGCQCWYCTKIMTKENVSLEHIHPVSKGGTYNRKNLVLACKKCNSKAGTKLFCEKWKLKLSLTNKTNLYQSKCIKI